MIRSSLLWKMAVVAAAMSGCGGDTQSDALAASGGSAGAGGSVTDSGSGGAGGATGDAGLADAAQAGQAGEAGQGGSPPGWHEPECSQVTGTWAVTFTSDDGATVAPGEGTLGGVAYTYGLAALDTPNVLVAEHAGRLLRSVDAGCSWTDIGAAPQTIMTLVAAPQGRVYGYGGSSDVLFRLDETTVSPLVSPASSIHGLGVDRQSSAHFVVGGEDGQLWESTDSGATFAAFGVPAPSGCFYVVAFDPNDLNHVVCGTIEDGTYYTRDGGMTWTASEGDATYTNTFNAVISPVDSDVVWIEGFQLGWHNGQQIGPEGRRIWRSEDGGATFAPVVVEEDTTATLLNGNLLAAHPADADVLYFTFGTPPVSGLPSESFLYRLDVSSSTLVEHKQNNIDGYDSLAFSPASPAIIYLGKTSERPSSP